MNLIVTICARGGSKGIPGKNIKDLNGKPLIAYTIQTAQEFGEKYNASVGLSTDSEEIKAVAERFSLSTSYERPAELATDKAGKVDAVRDLVLFEEKKSGLRFDYILDLDVTSPLRTVGDLNKAFEIIKSDKNALTLFSVNPAHRNPYFNMVEQKPDGYVKLVKPLEEGFLSRQSAPKVYDLNASFYFYRRDFFDSGLKTPVTDRSLIYSMDHLCFDLDEPNDFDYLEFLLKEQKLNFKI